MNLPISHSPPGFCLNIFWTNTSGAARALGALGRGMSSTDSEIVLKTYLVELGREGDSQEIGNNHFQSDRATSNGKPHYELERRRELDGTNDYTGVKAVHRRCLRWWLNGSYEYISRRLPATS